MFLPNRSAKAEYLYYDLGNISLNTTTSLLTKNAGNYGPVGTVFYGTSSQASDRVNGNIVRAGMIYHFNWDAAPVIVKFCKASS